MTTLSWDEAAQPTTAKANLAPGWHDAVLVAVEGKRSKLGAPQLVLDFEVGTESIRSWITFTGRGAKYAMADLVRLGITPEEAPEVTFDESKDWYEVDQNRLAEILTESASERAGKGYKILVKDDPNFGPSVDRCELDSGDSNASSTNGDGVTKIAF